MTYTPNAHGLYRATAGQAYSGDETGYHWRLSWVVVPDFSGPADRWAVYSDDAVPSFASLNHAKGLPARNGDFAASFDTFEEACQWADERAQLADVRGF